MQQEPIKPKIRSEIIRDDFIYVPSTGLYHSKKRTHICLSWYDCHRQLQREKLLMPTIPQFIAFINYLNKNYKGLPDATEKNIETIIDDILHYKDSQEGVSIGEWLDAYFTKQNNKFYINYNHRIDSLGNLIPQNSEPLEKCLMKNCWADILSPNKQGLPLRELKDKV